MALTLGRNRKRTPESTLMRSAIQMLGIMGYLWLEPRLLKAYSPEQLAAMVRQGNVKGLAFRMNTGAATGANEQYVQFGLPGHADIVVLQMTAGRDAVRWIGIELKTNRGRLSANQDKFHAIVNAMTLPDHPSVVVVRDVEALKGLL